MKEIDVRSITEVLEDLCIRTCYELPEDAMCALRKAREDEMSDLCRSVLDDLLQNAGIARSEHTPLCQDTGLAVVFIELGQDVHLTGGNLEDAVNEGIRRGYVNGYLRKSVVSDPLFDRRNTGDNTPAVLHTRIVPGDRLTITFAPKGAGSENMSCLGMLKPAQGVEGVRKFILDAVNTAGASPCPPIILGVGIGGTVEKAAWMAKHALLRPLDEVNPDERLAAFEKELLEEINRTGIGAQGFGGTVTALAVHLETCACHMASLPVVVNFQCHSSRHMTVTM